MKPILEIIAEEMDVLPRAFRYLIEHNPSNDAPYHSLHHMLRVTYYCNEGCEYHGIDGNRRRNLLVAAMFHDFNHSKGELKDPDNIIRAIEGVSNWYASNPMNQTNVDLPTVVNIIKATEYVGGSNPYTIPSNNLSMEQAIIRDADLMPSLEVDWINTMIVGPKTELNVDTFLQMAEGQQKFHSGIEMCSGWGRKKYEEEWSKIFRNLELLRSLL